VRAKADGFPAHRLVIERPRRHLAPSGERPVTKR
jgi:hypothetical protein